MWSSNCRTISSTPSPLPPPKPQVAIDLELIRRDLPTPDISYGEDNTIRGLLWLASFTHWCLQGSSLWWEAWYPLPPYCKIIFIIRMGHILFTCSSVDRYLYCLCLGTFWMMTLWPTVDICFGGHVHFSWPESEIAGSHETLHLAFWRNTTVCSMVWTVEQRGRVSAPLHPQDDLFLPIANTEHVTWPLSVVLICVALMTSSAGLCWGSFSVFVRHSNVLGKTLIKVFGLF